MTSAPLKLYFHLLAISGYVESLTGKLGGHRGVAVLTLHVELHGGHSEVLLAILDH